MIYFLLGLSVTLNILFFIITFIVIKFLKNKKNIFGFNDCIVEKDIFSEFMK